MIRSVAAAGSAVSSAVAASVREDGRSDADVSSAAAASWDGSGEHVDRSRHEILVCGSRTGGAGGCVGDDSGGSGPGMAPTADLRSRESD